MSKLLISLPSRSLRLSLVLLVLTFGVSSCGKVNPLSLLGSGGPNIAANTQAGQTNSQTIGTTEVVSQDVRDSQVETLDQSRDRTQVKAKQVEKVVVENKDSPWLILAFAVALFLDSPLRWPSQLYKGIQRWRKNSNDLQS